MTKPHPAYAASDNIEVPSVTTILKVLDKGEGLLHWAWQCGMRGESYEDIRDAAGLVGSLAHYMIACEIGGVSPELGNYDDADIARARKFCSGFISWRDRQKPTFIESELALVSQQHLFGGTLDSYALIGNGCPTLIDFKTGNVYPEHYYQICAYRGLLVENGYPVDLAIILRLWENGTFEEKIYDDFEVGWQIFLNCLSIYELKEGENAIH